MTYIVVEVFGSSYIFGKNCYGHFNEKQDFSKMNLIIDEKLKRQ